MKKLFTFIFLLTCGVILAQQIGDFGSAGTGNWGGTPVNWVVCVTPGTWDGATVAATTPDSNKNVFIRSGHTISLEGSGKWCQNIMVENGAVLTSSNYPANIRYIRVMGNFTNNGIVGNSPADTLTGLGLEFGRNCILSGTGTTVLNRIRPVSDKVNITLTIDMDVLVVYSGGTPGGGGAGVYAANSAFNDNVTITVNAGKKLELLANSNFQVGSSGSSNGTANTAFNIYGTVKIGSGGNVALGIAAGKTAALNIFSTGQLIVGNNMTALPTSLGTVEINIATGGLLKVGALSSGSLDLTKATMINNGTFEIGLSSKTTRILGTATFNSGSKLIINRATWPSGTLTFDPNSTVEYAGTTQDTLSKTNTTYPGLVINNAGGVLIDTNIVVNGRLTLSNGNLYTGIYSVQSASTFGEQAGRYVVGTLSTSAAVGTFASTLNGIGVSLNAGTNDLGTVNVTRISGPAGIVTVEGKSGIARRWNITSTNPPTAGRNLTFSWVADDDNSKDLTTAKVWRKLTGDLTWGPVGVQQNASTRSITVSTTAFSDWTVSDGLNSLPVELVSFTGTYINNSVVLSWRTNNESDNKGWDIEKLVNNEWNAIGFVSGKGDINTPVNYTFSDKVSSGKYSYRLKQYDFSGAVKYSSIIEVDAVINISSYSIQNYPNPFNPETSIRFEVPEKSFVSISVYNLLGQKVADVVNETFDKGVYQKTFNAKDLSSGIYVYKLSAGKHNLSKKMILMK